MSRYVLSIDQGTTGTTALIIGEDLKVLAKATKDFPQIFPKPGWVEHNPEDIWRSVCDAIREVLSKSHLDPKSIVAIGITNQRETAIVWDKHSGKPFHNAIVWQCRRTADLCNKLKKRGLEKVFRRKTGLVLDAYFSGTKIAWFLEHVPGLKARAAEGEAIFGTVDSFLVYKLTGGKKHLTDVTNASRTLLMNLKTLDYDAELLKILKIPRAMLPEIRSSAEIYGHTLSVPGLPDGIRISGIAGDQQAALFGQACFEPGEAKCTYGTGAFLLINTGNKIVPSKSGMLTTVAWKIGNKVTYALEGSTFIAGAAVQWLRDGLGIIRDSSEIEALALSVPDSGGVTFVPALTGLGAPYWNPLGRGMICGLTRGTTKAHIARAALEGIAFQIGDLAGAMQKDYGKKIKSMRVDGGAAVNNLMMRFQSDITQLTLIRPTFVETTGLGAAFLAGIGTGLWPDTRVIRSNWHEDHRFKPVMTPKEVRTRLAHWQNAVKRSIEPA